MKRSKRKTVKGTVISDRMDKSVVVVTETLARHPLYGKFVRKRKKLYAHDEENQCSVGDVVLLAETRPLSKTKRWRVVKIVKKAEKLE
ncbi:MAG: 30S ribosomal protein S17 [candidate division WOR-3 bacterium]